ncbi:MAG TPA: AtpZ/AtpI family protein [Chitinophagaceae bacterium]|nr:AtpZ/AtpI family protein [Chitinophagaceae bacterium]
MPSPNKPGKSNSNVMMQYAGLAFQFLAAIGIAVFVGLKTDEWLNWAMPVWVWVLPLLVISGMIYGIIRNSSKK